MTYQHLILLISIIFGLCIGSFLNVVIYRLPLMLKAQWQTECHAFLNIKQSTPKTIMSLLHPKRSFCPNCNTLIHWFDNLPIISFLLLRAKGRCCGQPISWRYPLIELLGGITTLFAFIHFGITLQASFASLISFALITLAAIDMEHQLLPDILTISLLWVGLLASLKTLWIPPSTAIIGAVAGYLSLWLVAKVFHCLRGQEGMGHGDMKLLAAFGAIMGWQALPLIVLTSCILALIFAVFQILRKRASFKSKIPYGTFLCISFTFILLTPSLSHIL